MLVAVGRERHLVSARGARFLVLSLANEHRYCARPPTRSPRGVAGVESGAPHPGGGAQKEPKSRSIRRTMEGGCCAHRGRSDTSRDGGGAVFVEQAALLVVDRAGGCRGGPRRRGGPAQL